jgi:hypothetical protein
MWDLTAIKLLAFTSDSPMTGWVMNEAIKLMDILSGRGKLPVR